MSVEWLHSVVAMFVELHENGEVEFDTANDQDYISKKCFIMFGKCFERWHERAGNKTLRQKQSTALFCKNVSIMNILFSFARFARGLHKGTGG